MGRPWDVRGTSVRRPSDGRLLDENFVRPQKVKRKMETAPPLKEILGLISDDERRLGLQLAALN